jgi:RNA polymerase sigma factor (sigma-70 family)
MRAKASQNRENRLHPNDRPQRIRHDIGPEQGLRLIWPSGRDSMTSNSQDGAIEAQVAAAVARCATGEHSALRVIYDIEAPRMVGVARRILRRQDLAEEAVQDTFMRVWRAARSFDPQKGAARTWLYAILRNCALSILRDESRFISDDDKLEEAAPITENALAHLPESSALRRCLERLDAERRAVVVLAYVHGLSHGELAGRFGVPLGTVKSWVRRSLISLQECMG